MIVAITGTGMPFPRLVDALAEYARASSEPLWVQAGATPLPAGLQGASIVPRAEILCLLEACDVVVCHGGSGAIHDAMVTGHVPVVVPRRVHLNEHVNDHQLEIAAELESDGRAIVVHDVASLKAAIEKARALSSKRERTRPGASLLAALRRDARALVEPGGASARRRWAVLRRLTRFVPVNLEAGEPSSELRARSTPDEVRRPGHE